MNKATKKKEEQQEEDFLQLDGFEESIVSGKDFIDKNLIIIPVSPILDILLNGGIQEGSYVTLTGPPKVGKTLTALDFLATSQKPEFKSELSPNGRHIFIYNIEGRLKRRDLLGIHHLDLEKVSIIESTPGNILSAQNYLEIAEKLINSNPGSIHLLDSLSSLCTEEERAEDMSKQFRADTPKLLSKFCRKINNVIPVNRNIVIGITHLMGNPSGYGAATQEKSGFAAKYQVDFKLHAKNTEPWTIEKTGEQIGQIVNWQCLSSGIGPPGRKDSSYIRYGYGIDKDMELLTVAESLNLVTKAGAWYTFVFLDKDGVKFCGKDKALEALKENQEWSRLLYQKFREYLKF